MTGRTLVDDDGPATPRPPRRTDTDAPHTSRERALKILFQADLRGERPADALARIEADAAEVDLLDDGDPDDEAAPPPPPVADPDDVESIELERSEPVVAGGPVRAGRRPAVIDDFTRTLVVGVGTHRDEVDALIDRHAQNWTVRRMPVVDRSLLRLATYEIVHGDTPAAIAIDEAIEFAKRLSGDRSPRFVNGVLEAIRRAHAQEGGTGGARTDGAPEGALPDEDQPQAPTA